MGHIRRKPVVKYIAPKAYALPSKLISIKQLMVNPRINLRGVSFQRQNFYLICPIIMPFILTKYIKLRGREDIYIF